MFDQVQYIVSDHSYGVFFNQYYAIISAWYITLVCCSNTYAIMYQKTYSPNNSFKWFIACLRRARHDCPWENDWHSQAFISQAPCCCVDCHVWRMDRTGVRWGSFLHWNKNVRNWAMPRKIIDYAKKLGLHRNQLSILDLKYEYMYTILK